MCAYSAISDWGRDRWIPVPQPYYPQPYNPPPTTTGGTTTNTGVTITREQWEKFQKLLAAAKDFDDKTGQKDCESAEKTAWMKEIEDRLNELELGVV